MNNSQNLPSAQPEEFYSEYESEDFEDEIAVPSHREISSIKKKHAFCDLT